MPKEPLSNPGKSDPLERIRLFGSASAKLREIADGKRAILTPDEAEQILDHMSWLSRERESLLSEYSAYDD